MSDLFWLTDDQMKQLLPSAGFEGFPKVISFVVKRSQPGPSATDPPPAGSLNCLCRASDVCAPPSRVPSTSLVAPIFLRASRTSTTLAL